jgi:hypothetical protein
MSVINSKLWKIVAGVAMSSSASLLLVGSASADSSTITLPANLPVVTIGLPDKPISADPSKTKIATKTSSDVIVTSMSSTVSTPVTLDQSGPHSAIPVSQVDAAVVLPVDGSITSTSMSSTSPANLVSSTLPTPPVVDTSVPVAPRVTVLIPLIRHENFQQSDNATVGLPTAPPTITSGVSSDPTSKSGVPTPPQSNGAFTKLAGGLAGSVVSRFVLSLSGSSSALSSIAGFIIVVLILVLSSLVIQSYGSALRRSGHTTAARSDISFFPFATPLSLDYGDPQAPIVLFDGVRDQNPYRFIARNALMKGGE